MKITRQLSVMDSHGICNGHLFKEHEGVLFNEIDQVDLLLYLEDIAEFTLYPDGLMSILQSEGDQSVRIVSYLDSSERKFPKNTESPYYYDDDFAVYHKQVDGYSGIECFGLNNDLSVEIADSGSSLWLDDKQIIVRNNKKVSGYLWTGEQVWSQLVKKTPIGTNRKLIEQGGGLILNAGGGNLRCIAKTSGEIVWQRTFDAGIDNVQSFGDDLHVAVGIQMCLVSPADGAVNHHFTAAGLPENENLTTLWSDGVYLYVISAKNNRILVFNSNTFDCLADIQLPRHPKISYGVAPIICNGVNHLSLVNGDPLLAGIEGGLLTWTVEDIANGVDLCMVEPPAITIIVAANKKGKESYHIVLPCDDIHELIRFGEIEARKVAALRGRQTWENPDTLNKQFNGEIVLMINPDIGQAQAPILDMMIKRTNRFCDMMDIRSGSGRQAIKVSWQFND
ncbi:MAG: hypothetical protein ACI8WB_005416 [Phenylobacterium sp.]|jgi:hypothetical protein